MAKTKGVCITCISLELKKEIIDSLDDDNIKKIFEGLPECEDNNKIILDVKKSKKVSEYSKFIGNCISQTVKDTQIPVSEAMKKCAKTWTSNKKTRAEK